MLPVILGGLASFSANCTSDSVAIHFFQCYIFVANSAFFCARSTAFLMELNAGSGVFILTIGTMLWPLRTHLHMLLLFAGDVFLIAILTCFLSV